MLDTYRFRGEHQTCPFRGPPLVQHAEKDEATGVRSEPRKAKSIQGRVPEEGKSHPPRAAPGSHHLPWDSYSISATRVRLPDPATHGARGGWDGEFAFARDAGGGFRHGGITNATARTRNAGGRCVAGRRPNGSGNAGPIPWDADGTPRRNASGGRGPCCARCAQPGLARRTDAKPRLPTLPRTPARGHAAKGCPRFFATAPAVMSHRGILPGWRLRTVATAAVRPWSRPGIASASGCGASGKRAASNAASNTRR